MSYLETIRSIVIGRETTILTTNPICVDIGTGMKILHMIKILRRFLKVLVLI